ncbi:hypothetical protein BVY04_00280 [bacterium M21]|nr:hypothetical protein BVY04_00280 [bacterium M21]
MAGETGVLAVSQMGNEGMTRIVLSLGYEPATTSWCRSLFDEGDVSWRSDDFPAVVLDLVMVLGWLFEGHRVQDQMVMSQATENHAPDEIKR